MPRALLLLPFFLLLLPGCGGELHQVSQVYERQGEAGSFHQRKAGKFRARLIIAGTHSDNALQPSSEFVWLGDSQSSLGGPYSLILASSYYGKTEEPFTILEATITIGDEPPIVLISPEDPPIEVSSKEWLPHADAAKHRISLKDLLSYKEGQRVKVEATFRVPESGKRLPITSIFQAETRESRVSKSELLFNGT